MRVKLSSANQWARPNGCPAYVQMDHRHRSQTQNSAAEEGTLAHALAQSMVQNLLTRGLGFNPKTVVTRTLTDKRWTDEMYHCALIYFEDVKALIAQTNVFGGTGVGVEKLIPAPRIVENCSGRVDFYLYHPQGNTLHVYDYKYGRGVVEADDNWQLYAYAAALIDFLNLREALPAVHLHVVQPRASHPLGSVRSARHRADFIIDAALPQLRAAAALAVQPDAPSRTGRHCLYCSGRAFCPAAREAASHITAFAGMCDSENLTPDEISSELVLLRDMAKILKGRITGLEAEAVALIEQGTPLPHWTSTRSLGNRFWTLKPTELSALGAGFEIELTTEKPVTPAEAERRGLPKDIVKSLTDRALGAAKLTRDNNALARAVFGAKK